MLFSHEATARLMGELYECAWEMVRPVPRVEIDFGNGTKLTRTLQGNVATYLCTSDGRTVDIIPGVVDATTYRARLVDGARLIAEAAGRASIVAEHHARVLTAPPVRRVELADLSKARVESRVKDALAEDTEHNMLVRMPKVHAMLAERPLARPADLRAALFRDVLGYDIEDPYLGLAPLALGGEDGRR